MQSKIHLRLAYRFCSDSCPVFYIADVKGRVGDWGYTTEIGKAIALTPRQQQRFAADCRAVGVDAQFIEPAVAEAQSLIHFDGITYKVR